MSDRTFSLFHHVAPPKGGLESKPPLLLLLHGYGANEDDLFSLAPYLDGRFMIVSARGRSCCSPCLTPGSTWASPARHPGQSRRGGEQPPHDPQIPRRNRRSL